MALLLVRIIEYDSDTSLGHARLPPLVDQVAAGTVNESSIDDVVKTILRTKFSLGLFEGTVLYE